MFSKRLKELRTAKGITQEELGQIIFVSRSAIAKWEQGKGMPSKESLNLLSEYFKIAPDELLKEEDPILIIDNIERNSKKNKLVLTLCFSVIIIILVTLLIIIAFGNNKYKKIEGFYNENFLIENGISNIKPVEGMNGYHTKEGTYFCTVLSSDKMHNYAKYLYEFLSTSLNISYLSTNYYEDIYEENKGYKINNYLIRTNNYKDHYFSSTNIGYYKFYFISNTSKNRKTGEKVFPTCITLRMPFYGFSEEYLDSKGYDYNFTMKIYTTEESNRYAYYLGHEYFDIEEVKLNNKNWLTYYEKEELINVKGVYITIKEIKKDVECIGFLYCNIYIDVEVEDTKLNTRDEYKKNIYNVNVDEYISQSINAQELGNYSSGSRHITQINVQYEILEGAKVWLLTKK